MGSLRLFKAVFQTSSEFYPGSSCDKGPHKSLRSAEVNSILPLVIYGGFPIPQYRPQNTIILIMGTPHNGTPNFGKLPSMAWTSKFAELHWIQGAAL